MDDAERRRVEYQTMRETIGRRGTARMVLAPVVFMAWAATAIATAAVITVAISTLVPLLVLAAGFEAVFRLHMSVERIGRYLQVFYEPDDGWEHVVMEFGRRFPKSGTDPLFSRLFAIAVSVNYLPVALGGEVTEMVALAVAHLVLVNRIRLARAVVANQRADDMERFLTLRSQGAHTGVGVDGQ